METKKFDSLNKEEENLEIERCQESFAYFYNNYCKKEGMPEYSEDVFKDYLKQVEKERNKVSRRKFGKSYFFPLTYQEALKKR
jgi:predicted metal-dependent peptidase